MKSIFTLLLSIFSFSAFAQTFTVYTDPAGDNSLQAIAIDEDNDRIWVGTNATTTGETIAFFEDGQWTKLNANTLGLLSGRLEDLIVNEGIVEAASFGGLSRIDWGNQTFETWTSTNSDLTVDAVLALAKDVDNDILYVGTGSGFELQAFDGQDWTDFDEISNTRTIEYDAANQTLWVGTLTRGLFKVENGTVTNYIWSNSAIPSGEIYDLEIDPTGKVWMVIDDKGLVSFDGTNFEQFTTENSDINDNDPTLVTVDAEGVVWFGGFNYGGITSYDGITFTSYLSFESDLPTNNIRQMKAAANGDLWMATSVGLVQLATGPNSVKEIQTLNFGISPNPTRDIMNIQMDDQIHEIEILNVSGQVLWQAEAPSLPLKTAFLKQGLYFLKIYSREGKIGVRKFIKE
ncbi:T9SS type A sorting domain-containing protein [Lewinella cohaerens]|uniref:T9SS type A sorting domain-containing protein n=1 Tax=Lewinella cohaerens TaxID=70995 RepID=UPI0003691928|nr:T9SS type A sorting domain-containing protein [Lewinella cohaerens]